ncbi:type III secretion system outer membrane ring subunit SctC [Caballeronia fortuita]|nr:type III secretion system outer membrane ring subunit SctC [Caballeronia fortuita]
MRYVAHDSRLADVLIDVASAGGLRLDVARNVRGNVSGVFENKPSEVFRTLAEAWGLVWYFDGQTIHVSTADDVRSRTISFAPLTRDTVAALLRSLDLDDPHLPLSYSKDSVKIVGPSRYVDAISEAITKAQERPPVQEPSFEQTQIRVFRLRYAQAQDITYNSGGRQQTIAGVASLLRRLMENTSAPRASATRGTRTDSAHSARGGVPPLPGVPGLRETALAASSLDSEAELPQSSVTPARRSIIADARTNSVVVYDVPEMMPAYERAISMLDQRQDLVEISALVMDVSSDAARELGIRWGGAASSRNAGVPYGVGLSVQPDGTSAAGMSDAGLTFTTLIGNSVRFLYGQIHALEQDGRARVLSRPRVLTLNNAEAVLSSRNSVYVRVAGNQDANLFNVDTGLTLKVTPTVEQSGAARGSILLSVQIEDGSFDNDASVDGIPRVNTNSIITQAVVGDGESLLIGGYEYEHSLNSGSKVPILGDLPVIGALFNDDRTVVGRTERLILITPQIKRFSPATGASAPVTDPSAITLPVVPDAASSSPIAATQRPHETFVAPPLPPGVQAASASGQLGLPGRTQ